MDCRGQCEGEKVGIDRNSDMWMQPFPVLILGNKSDINSERIEVDIATAEHLASTAGFLYFFVSALKDEGISEAVDILTMALVPFVLFNPASTPFKLASLVMPPPTPPKSPRKDKQHRPARSDSSGTLGRSISPSRANLPVTMGPSSSTFVLETLSNPNDSPHEHPAPTTPKLSVMPTMPTSHFPPPSPETPEGRQSVRANRGSGVIQPMEIVVPAADIPRGREGCCVVL